jgi:class 3 adenylate cyclase
MNHDILDQKLHALAAFPNIKAETAAKFGEILKELDDWDLLRINPLRFAEEHGFDRSETMDLFIHGAKIGLFDFVWNMICPSCGGTEYTHNSINEVEEAIFHCSICHFDVPSNLDDQVEVAFMINPSIKKLDINPFKDIDSYHRYFFSPNFERSQPLEDYINDVTHSAALIDPDESKDIVFEAKPGELYRLLSIDLHSAMSMQTTDRQGSGTQSVSVDILPTGFSPNEKVIAPGAVTLRIQNLRNRPTGAILVLSDLPRIQNILERHPSRFRPFLTGKMLLNNQGFRELFRVQNLIPNLKLNIRSLTILFTDLKGSTELYDKTGDAFAYNLVQEHFKILTRSVRRNSGAIVKTMGDAIMATFSLPQEGVNAAVEMINEMQSLNEKLRAEEYELGLKIGLHEGPALAINADERVDYFGQAVNIAARVQGLAKSSEIWITEPIFLANRVPDVFYASGFREEEQSVFLKGIREATTVYKMHRLASGLKPNE